MRHSQVAVVCVFLTFAFGGCIFSPHKGKGGGGVQPPTYQIPASPNAVLENLKTAYSHRDSTAYKSLYDENYQGTSIDQQDPSPKLLTYTKADEAMHIAGLAKNTTVTAVDLDLVPPGAMLRISDAGDPPGWALIQNPVFRLSIKDGSDEWVIPFSEEDIEFHFIPTLDTTSPTDTTWKIVKWVEVRR